MGVSGRRPARTAFAGEGVERCVVVGEPVGVHDDSLADEVLDRVGDVPDVGARYRRFKELFVRAHRQALDGIEARVDGSTLRGMAKVYGTCKPAGGLSRFFGGRRVEDMALREYLVGLAVSAARHPAVSVPVTVGAELPAWFVGLLSLDARLRDLWDAVGKRGDCTNSGYDFSVVRYLADRGYRDVDALGTILSLRPVGFAERCAKGASYLERTVGRALGAR